MKMMFRLASLSCIAVLLAGPAIAADAEDLEAMLNDFLRNSSTEDAHASFWAEDLIYTSSAGLRFGKADIMAGFDGSAAGNSSDDESPAIVFSAEDVDIRIHGRTAIVAFKLVGTPADKASGGDVLYYFNTGTFVQRDGAWKVVAWQATKIPPS